MAFKRVQVAELGTSIPTTTANVPNAKQGGAADAKNLATVPLPAECRCAPAINVSLSHMSSGTALRCSLKLNVLLVV